LEGGKLMSSGSEPAPLPDKTDDKPKGLEDRLSNIGILPMMLPLVLIGVIFIVIQSCSAVYQKDLIGNYSLVSTNVPGMKRSSLELKEQGKFKMTLFVGDYEEMDGSWGLAGETKEIAFFDTRGTTSTEGVKLKGEVDGSKIILTITEKGKTYEVVYEKVKYQSQ
jgi:hypothetical protein